MKSNKIIRGYIFSRPFMNERVPQHSQNIIITVPSLYLLSSVYLTWVQEIYTNHKEASFLLVGSDSDTENNFTNKHNISEN